MNETTLTEDLENLVNQLLHGKITEDDAIQTIHNISEYYKKDEL